MRRPITLSLLPALLLTDPLAAQSLFQRPVSQPQPMAPTSEPAESGGSTRVAAAPAGRAASSAPRLTLRDASLFVVIPPEPRRYQQHDKIEVIINESAISKAEQSLDTKKTYDLRAELRQFPSLTALLTQLELRDGIGADTPNVGVRASNKMKGEGTYERKDRLTARISALVLDVKPNGHLVIEARETIQQDAEIKTMVLAGIVDPKDVTNVGTVQSAQVANLNIRIEHEGRVKDAGDKGLIPRVLEAIFNF
jgi:flagellar L-ring protein precursor FlgH